MCVGGVPVVPRHTVKFQTLKKFGILCVILKLFFRRRFSRWHKKSLVKFLVFLVRLVNENNDPYRVVNSSLTFKIRRM